MVKPMDQAPFGVVIGKSYRNPEPGDETATEPRMFSGPRLSVATASSAPHF